MTLTWLVTLLKSLLIIFKRKKKLKCFLREFRPPQDLYTGLYIFLFSSFSTGNYKPRQYTKSEYTRVSVTRLTKSLAIENETAEVKQ